MKNLSPTDIARRLLIQKPYWFEGKPTITLTGNNGSFGELVFDFKDQVVKFNLYISSRKHILEVAESAINNFWQPL